MYKAVKKNKSIRRYIEYLVLNTGATIVHWEYNTRCISAVEAKMFTPIFKYIGIPAYFLQEQSDNDIFVTKYEKSDVVPADMCTKPCSGLIISQGTKWVTGFRFYPTSDTEHYQIIILNEFVFNKTNYL